MTPSPHDAAPSPEEVEPHWLTIFRLRSRDALAQGNPSLPMASALAADVLDYFDERLTRLRERAEKAEAQLATVTAERDAEAQRAIAAEEQLRRWDAKNSYAQSEFDAAIRVLPGTRWMDPPDGGSPTLAEQIANGVALWRKAEAQLATATALLEMGQDADEAVLAKARAEERERSAMCADKWCTISGETIRLMAGEMTAQEIRTARAVAAGIRDAIRALTDQPKETTP